MREVATDLGGVHRRHVAEARRGHCRLAVVAKLDEYVQIEREALDHALGYVFPRITHGFTSRIAGWMSTW
jgi:hypothetical protein